MTGEPAQDDDDVLACTKTAQIEIAANYPIVSAYEFEFLKGEEVIKERLDGRTLYMIVQRPLTYFDNVRITNDHIFFDIADSANAPLECRLNLVEAGICETGQPVDIQISFYSKKSETPQQPFRDVAAIRVYDKDNNFLVWWSPQKLLFEVLVNGLPVAVSGNQSPLAFVDFRVLYVGKAFDQKVWKRLTGHTKMQRLLTIQSPVGASPEAKAPFEISLALLSVVGLQEATEFFGTTFTIPAGVEPIPHKFAGDDDQAFGNFITNRLVELGDAALTTAVEAMLVNRFRPQENKILYESYPNIAGGMRSKGYSHSELTIERLPVRLYTDHFDWSPTFVEEAGGDE
jgi:hypothetical protein